MIDSSHVKAHQHGTGARGGNQNMGAQKEAQHENKPGRGCAWQSAPSCYARSDCTQTEALKTGFRAHYLLVNKAYDSRSVVALSQGTGAEPVIPPRRHWLQPRHYDAHLHEMRHLAENTFQRLKQWRGIATHFAKNTARIVRLSVSDF